MLFRSGLEYTTIHARFKPSLCAANDGGDEARVRVYNLPTYGKEASTREAETRDGEHARGGDTGRRRCVADSAGNLGSLPASSSIPRAWCPENG